MRCYPIQAFWLVVCLTVAVSSCTPSPNKNAHTAAAATGTTCAAAKNNNNNQIFGVPEAKLIAKVTPTSTISTTTKQTIHKLRGGELHEPETLQDTEALVLSAATDRKLLVIDFTASWW
jgi:hypothetical protein